MATSSPLTPEVDGPTVRVGRWIALQVDLLRSGAARGDAAAREVLRFAGLRIDGTGLDVDSFRLAVAKDHWYESWEDALAHGDEDVDVAFEAAADAVHAGDLDSLRRLLDGAPSLVEMRSPFPHHQTLIHHVAANGIEVERQMRSPANAVEVARLLLDRGADANAGCDSYGGGPGATPLSLLVSSAGPAAAGTQVGLIEELCRGGARADGVDDDRVPLWTAITFGHTRAAEALARCGARVDNLCFAAALGDLDAVMGYFDPGGGLRPGLAPVDQVGRNGPVLDPERVVDYALIWAAAHDRRPVVEFLLTQHPDIGVREPCFQSTALGAARYFGHRQVAARLEEFSG